MTNILKFPIERAQARARVRHSLAALANAANLSEYISIKLAQLVEAMDKNAHNAIKLEKKDDI